MLLPPHTILHGDVHLVRGTTHPQAVVCVTTLHVDGGTDDHALAECRPHVAWKRGGRGAGR